MPRFARCKCFLNSNIYLPRLNLHVRFENDSQFCSAYGKLLESRGCSNWRDVLDEVQREMQRRREIPEQSQLRTEYIKVNYLPLFPEVFTLQEHFFSPAFSAAFQQFSTSATLSSFKDIAEHLGEDVYTFPLFSPAFCWKFCQELRHFENSAMPKSRPNSMNRYGVLLDEVGFNPNFLNPLREDYLEPLCRLLYPKETGAGLDSHKAFTVHYELGKDVDLGFHFDNAEVTLNVCLEADCQGGELNFGSFGLEHRTGYAVLHRGSQQHSALPLESGRRVNLIVWMRSSSVRNLICPMCSKKPVLEPVDHGFGDGFTL